MIDIEEKYLTEIIQILNKHVPNCEVRVFGSRINGKAAKFSDLDLALICDEKLDWKKIELLKDAFASSNLPMTIDVIDLKAVSEDFQAIVEKNYEIIQKKH